MAYYEEVVPRVYRVPLGFVNAFVLVEEEGLTLIDAGMAWHARRLRRALQALGFGPAAVRQVLVTHADGDHVGGLPALLAQAPAAQVLASPHEAQALREGRFPRPLRVSPRWAWALRLSEPFFRVPAVPQVETLPAEGGTLPVLGGLEVIPTPGHTPGHVAFYLPAQGVLFAGDALRAPSGQLQVSRGVNTWDEEQALASARRLAALNPKVICVGHGPVLRGVAIPA